MRVANRRHYSPTRPPQSAPKDADTTEPKKAPAAPKSQGEWAVGVALLTFGVLAWLGSAKYTLTGWVVGLNTALAWLGLPVVVPAPVGWFVLLAVPLGVVYSRVETRVWHRRSSGLLRTPLFWLGWIVVVGTDIGSTYLGVRAPAPDAWALTQQIATSGGVSFVVSLILTFAPEWMVLGGMKFIRR